jgi:hypothetical protein
MVMKSTRPRRLSDSVGMIERAVLFGCILGDSTGGSRLDRSLQ